jgi:putative flippase GtrA
LIDVRVIKDRRERVRFARFAVVGTIGAVVDFAAFNLLSSVIGIHHVWASVFSFAAAILSNFTWNRYWTYPDSRSKSLPRQLLEFVVVNLFGLGIRTPLFAGLSGPLEAGFELIPILPIGIFTPEFLGHNGALAFAVLVVMLWNFFVNRYWTYNDVE